MGLSPMIKRQGEKKGIGKGDCEEQISVVRGKPIVFLEVK